MFSQKKSLQINELKEGMISSMDISFNGNLLVTNGAIITQPIIDKLKKTYIIDMVDVYSNDHYNRFLTLKIKTSKELENTFNEFSSNLHDIFNNISSSKVPEMNYIRAFSQKIHQELNAPGMVIKNIVFYNNRNTSIYRHSVNVAALSFILGKWLGLNKQELSLLTYAAILHDFGKTQISNNILNKKNNLNPKEYEVFKTHPILGYNFVKQIPFTSPSLGQAILMHHERLDGSGYPFRIKGDKIPKFSKIIAIADLFDELSSNRYSRKIKGPLDALKVIQDESLTKLDNFFCNMFINNLINYYIGENVLLNDERCCKIIQIHINDLTSPLLLNNNDFLDLKKEKDLYVKHLII